MPSKPLTVEKIGIGTITLLVTVPIFIVLFQVINLTGESWYHLTQNLLGIYTKNTLWVVLGVSTITLLLGVPVAWVVSLHEFPGRKPLEWLLVLPLSIPTFINGISYSGLTDFTGPIRVAARSIGLGDIALDILNLPGVIFVMSVVLYPYVYLATRAVLALQGGAYLEATKALGAGTLRSLFKVGLPLAWPGIFGGLLLVIMEVLNDYGTVHYFGISTFTAGIFKSWLSLGDMPSAVLLSIFLVLFVVVLLLIESIINRRKSYRQQGRPVVRERVSGRKKWLYMTLCLVPFLLGFVIPVAQMTQWLALSWERTNWERLGLGIAGTLQVAGITATLIVLLAWMFNFLKRTGIKSRFWKAVSQVAVLGYSMPGAVLGIGVVTLVLFFNPGWLFASTIALIFGLCSRFFAVGQNPLASSYEKIPLSLDESSQTMGASDTKRLFQIHFPLMKFSLAASFILVLIDVTKELPITLILRPFNFETLSTLAFQYAKDEMVAQSALPSLLIILISAVPVFFLQRIFVKS